MCVTCSLTGHRDVMFSSASILLLSNISFKPHECSCGWMWSNLYSQVPKSCGKDVLFRCPQTFSNVECMLGCDSLHCYTVPACLCMTFTLLSSQRAVSLTRGWASSVGSGRRWRRQSPTGRTASPTRPTVHQSEGQTWMTAGPWHEEVESVSTT